MGAVEVEANLMKTILTKVVRKTCSMVVVVEEEEEAVAVTVKRTPGAMVPTLPGVLSASTRSCVLLPVPKFDIWSEQSLCKKL